MSASAGGPAQQPRSATRTARWAGSVVLLLAAVVASSPLFLGEFSCGHDFDFHAISWLDVLASWRHGILYPHWSPSPNFGAGEPRFIFYPPLTWMMGAALGAVLPWGAVAPALSFLLLAGIGFATRALAREVVTEGPATLAGCWAIFCGYTLFTVYERSAYAELAGGIWIPLLLMLILREGREAGGASRSFLQRVAGGAALPLALVMAAAWLANAPVGVMASYLLVSMAVVVAATSRSWLPILRSAAGLTLGLGLAAFYLVPAAYEQRWVEIRQATDDPGLLIQNSFLFGRHRTAQLELHDIELFKVSCIAVSMIAVALLAFAICAWRRRVPGDRRWWLPLAVLPVAILLLQLPVSLPIWNLLPKLRFLQFPWRWLVALEAPMGLFVAAALWTGVRWRRGVLVAGCGLMFAVIAAAAGVLFHQGCDADDIIWSVVKHQRDGTGVEGTDEYAPPGADNSIIAMGLPDACLVQDPKAVLARAEPDLTPQWMPDQGTCRSVFSWAPDSRIEHRRLRGNIPAAGYLVLRLRQYPAWRVTVNGHAVQNLPQREDGLISVPASKGAFDLRADWISTADVIIGRSITLLAMLVITGVGVRLRRAGFDARVK